MMNSSSGYSRSASLLRCASCTRAHDLFQMGRAHEWANCVPHPLLHSSNNWHFPSFLRMLDFLWLISLTGSGATAKNGKSWETRKPVREVHAPGCAVLQAGCPILVGDFSCSESQLFFCFDCSQDISKVIKDLVCGNFLLQRATGFRFLETVKEGSFKKYHIRICVRRWLEEK